MVIKSKMCELASYFDFTLSLDLGFFKKRCIIGVYSFLSDSLNLFIPVTQDTSKPMKIAVKKPIHVYHKYDSL